MATCPACGTSSRTDPGAMKIEAELIAKPLGTWSLSGSQLKANAYTRLRMSCRCGWSIAGVIEGEEFLGDPATQVFPEDPDRSQDT